MEKGLTPRQWCLKRFLEDNFIPGHFFSIEELVRGVLLPNGEPAYKLNTDPHKHDKCIALSGDIKTINWSCQEGYKIIIKDSFGGAKLCESEVEFNTWRNAELEKVNKKYQYLNNLKWKADRDGIAPIINQAGNPVDYDKKDLKSVEVYMKPTEEEKGLEYTGIDIFGNPTY